MIPHRILKSFRGSQDGLKAHHFHEGTICPLSESLALIAVSQGWAEPVNVPERRDTKVIEPEEVKAEPPASTPAEPARTTLTLDPAKRKRKG